MEHYELDAILEGYENKQKPNWEQARLIAYMIALTNSTKKLSPTDIIEFNWDNKDMNDSTTDWDEISKMRNKINDLNNGSK